MKLWNVIAIVLALCLHSLARAQAVEEVRYDDHAMIVADIDSMVEFRAISEVGIPLACRPGPGPQAFAVPKERLADLEKLGVDFNIAAETMQDVIDNEKRLRAEARARRGATFYDDFATYAEVIARIDDLAAGSPNATVSTIGQSLEGRDINVVRITGPGDASDRPVLVIIGTQHAREWISPMTVTYTAEQLITQYGSDPVITQLVDTVEFHIIPIVNPDGYIYSHTSNRLWRKNRRLNTDLTRGVDLNRNWSYEWGGENGDPQPSSEQYRGPSPFSEPESTAVSSYIDTLAQTRDIQGFIDCHAYSQIILGPWAYTDDFEPPRAAELRATGRRMSDAVLAVDGVFYADGLGTDGLIYSAAGVAPDWAFAEHDASAWLYEMRPDSPFPGFELPPSQIDPGVREAFAGFMELAALMNTDLLIEPKNVPQIISSNEQTTVSFTVLPFNGAAIDAAASKLFYETGSGRGFTSVPVTLNGSTLSADLPATPCGTLVEFYLEAATTGGSVTTYPGDSPATLLAAQSVDLSVALNDDFESDLGWTASSSASTGQWQRGVPVIDPTWTYSPLSDADGSGSCYLTQNTAGNTDVDGGSVALVSPQFALDVNEATYAIAYSYYLYLTVEDGVDRLLVEGSTDGVAWSQLAVHDTNGGRSWRSATIDDSTLRSAGLIPSATVRLRFTANDTGSASIVEAGVDAVRITAELPCPPTPACPGDIADGGDGVVDGSDLDVVLFAWGQTGAPGFSPADVSGPGGDPDGVVDGSDLDVVLFNWQLSCN